MGQYVFNEAGNQVWGGDITYSTNPVVQNETTNFPTPLPVVLSWSDFQVTISSAQTVTTGDTISLAQP